MGELAGPGSDSDEIRRLRSCINNLISLQALPAIWAGHEASQILSLLLEALVGTLHLDLAYARAIDSPDGRIEVVRGRHRQLLDVDAATIGRAFEPWVKGREPLRPITVQNPIGRGQLSIAPLRLGIQEDAGVLVVGSERADFPNAMEMMLLRTATNQATIALHESSVAARQRQTAQELERRVAERTAQLTRSNEELRGREIELQALHEELTAELRATTRLHELSTRLLEDTELQPLLEEVLDAAIQLLSADFGNVQLYDPDTRTLRIVAQRGFDQEFLAYFNHGHEGTGSCGTALKHRSRVVVEDVQVDPSFAAHLKIVAAAGYRAVQSTPLISRSGDLLGMLSTHFRQPHRPLERDLRMLDLYAHQAAEIIERRWAEERLHASEERFRNYFDLGLIGGALISPDKGCLEVNDELCRMLGYARAELLRKTWAEMTHPDELAADHAQLERVLASELDAYALDKRWVRKDGTAIDSITAARAVRRSDGTADYLVVLVQDITARKRAEESLQQLQADLAHVARVSTMGELTASIAHEVNQPIGAVVNNASACLRWLAARNLEEARHGLECIIRDGMRASEVVNRIRALSAKTAPKRTWLQLNDLIHGVLTLAHSRLLNHQISLTLDLSATLPELLGDRVQLQQVLLNLIMNAIEAIHPVVNRPRELGIRTSVPKSGEVQVTVQDSGVGLDSQASGRLFDPFFTTKPEGMGLGLSISRRIIDAHGGQLWATPNPDYGTTMIFVLPAATDRTT